LDFSVS